MKMMTRMLIGLLVGTLGLHAMEEGLRTPSPKRRRTFHENAPENGASSREILLEHYRGLKAELAKRIDKLTIYPGQLGGSMEEMIWRLHPIKARAARELGAKTSPKREVISIINERITGLEDIINKARAAGIESEPVLGIKMKRQFSLEADHAQEWRDKLVFFRDDVAKKGDQAAIFVKLPSGRNLLPSLDEAATLEEGLEEPPIF